MFSLKILITLLCVCVINCFPLDGDAGNITKETGNKYRLTGDTVPIHYNLKINPHFPQENLTFDGETSVDLEVRKPTAEIVVHVSQLTINESETTLEKDGEIFKPKEQILFEDENEMLHLRFENILQPGIYRLNFIFQGQLFHDLYGTFLGHFTDNENNDVFLVATHFQPIFARRTFPCWDEPAMKATFNVSIKHHGNFTALSNMPLRIQEPDETDGKVWSHFETTPKMSTNILAFAVVTGYEHIENADGTMRVWSQKESIQDVTYFMETAELATEELTRYMNSSTRVPKMDYIALKHYSARATENWGLIVYGESAMFYNNETFSTHAKIQNILTTTHEISHQWFGNLVSPAWWKYFWLSEGMATYLKYYITDKMYANWRLMDSYVNTLQSMFTTDDSTYSTPINQDYNSSWEIFTRNRAVLYWKSSIILRMLSHIVTEDVFRSGLLKYIDKHEYGNVTSDDLWEAMEDALADSDVPHDDFQVKQVMDTWVEQSGFPLVTVTRDYDASSASIRQEPSPSNRDKRQKEWWIPISYATTSTPDFTSTTATRWLPPGVENVTISGIDDNDWIIVNLQESGYYRVNYDPTNWNKIAKYLRLDDHTKVHVANRAQLVDDAYHLMTLGRIDAIVYVDLTNYLSRETDYVVWTTVFQHLVGILKYLRNPEIAAIVKPHIVRLMDNYVKHLGYEERPDDDDVTKIRRIDALSWACALGHRECRAKAAEKLLAYLDDPKTNYVTPDTQFWTFCMGLRNANLSTWQKWNYLYVDTSYRYLNCLEDPEVVEDCLKVKIWRKWPRFYDRGPDRVNFKSLYDHQLRLLMYELPFNTNIQLNYFMEHWDTIDKVVRDDVIEDLIMNLDTQDQIDKVKEFLQNKGVNKDSKIHYREKNLRKIAEKVEEFRRLFTSTKLN